MENTLLETAQAPQVNVEINKEQRKDMHFIDPRLIIQDESKNIRVNYGNIEELKLSIIENGVLQPLIAIREGENFRLTDGFRRNRAIQSLLEEGYDIARVPMIIRSAKGYSEEQRLLEMFITQDNKKLEPIEEATIFDKLVKFGWERKKIAQKVGKTEAHVSNMLALMAAPEAIQKEVREGNISATAAVKLVTTEKDAEKQVEILTVAKEKAKSEGKTKVTEKVLSLPKKEVKRDKSYLDIESMVSDIPSKFESERTKTMKKLLEFLNGEVRYDEMVDFILDDDIA